jgi:hypothetical protein
MTRSIAACAAPVDGFMRLNRSQEPADLRSRLAQFEGGSLRK